MVEVFTTNIPSKGQGMQAHIHYRPIRDGNDSTECCEYNKDGECENPHGVLFQSQMTFISLFC